MYEGVREVARRHRCRRHAGHRALRGGGRVRLPRARCAGDARRGRPGHERSRDRAARDVHHHRRREHATTTRSSSTRPCASTASACPAVVQGRIGIVVRRDGDRWTAGRCDVVPGWRMANALSGRQPCPKPRVRISRVRVDGLVAHVTLRLSGDVTALRTRLGPDGPAPAVRGAGVSDDRRGLQLLKGRAGSGAKIRAEGGFGPGCGTARKRASTARKTISSSADRVGGA